MQSNVGSAVERRLALDQKMPEQAIASAGKNGKMPRAKMEIMER
jgi:hypothetical protein